MKCFRFLSAFLGIHIFVCAIVGHRVFAQASREKGSDGRSVSSPKNIDVVLFSVPPDRLTLKELEERWGEIGPREFVIQEMGAVRHEKVLEFLFRVATVDPVLYKSKLPSKTYGVWAAHNMIRMGHPNLPGKLAEILRAPFVGVPAEEVRKIKGMIAQYSLRYPGADKKLIFSILDKNAQEGNVLCPYSDEKGGRFVGNGKWVDAQPEPEARDLLYKWLDLKDRAARIEAAYCAAKAGICDAKVREIAEAVIGDGSAVPVKLSHESGIAERVLHILGAHGDLKSAQKYDRIQVERQIRKASIGNPEADKNIRESLLKEFIKKWKE